MYKSFVIAIVLLKSSQLFSQKPVAEIPFTMDRNLIIIPIKMANNETQKFVFDTGTEGIMLLDSLAKRYKYLPAQADTIVDQNGQFVGIAERFNIPKISVPGLALKHRLGTIIPEVGITSGRKITVSNEAFS